MAKTYSSEHIDPSLLGSSSDTSGTHSMNKIDTPFWTAAFLSFVASVSLWFLVDKLSGIFVGIWVPSILALWCGIRMRINDYN